jgi:3-hydroxyacyl-[acyl-carrier-protein] dehydratase
MTMDATTATNADLDLIQRIIPHRYPFLLIDKVRDIVLNESCVGIKMHHLQRAAVSGPFPRHAGLSRRDDHRGHGADERNPGRAVDGPGRQERQGLLHGRRRGEVPPQGGAGRRAGTACQGGARRRRVWKFEGRAMVEGELACEATFMAMFDVPKA